MRGFFMLILIGALAGCRSGGFLFETTSALEEPAKSEAGRATVAEREAEVDVSTDVPADVRAAQESEADTSSTAFGQAEVMEILAKAEWGRSVAPYWNQDAQSDSIDVLSLTEDSDEASEDFAWRWSNAQIDQLLLKPKKYHPAFLTALSKEDPVLATNGAIGLVRLGDRSGEAILRQAVESPSLTMPQRQAALEAFGSLDGSAGTLREWIDLYGDFPGKVSARLVEIHVESLESLQRHVDPVDEPRFARSLLSRSRKVRLAAIRAYAESNGESLPNRLLDLAGDSDPATRIEVYRTLGKRKPEKAISLLVEGSRDVDLNARLEALHGLGQVGTPVAKEALEKSLDDRSELVRAVALASMARLGESRRVFAAVSDSSWRVRQVVARTLAEYPAQENLEVARALLDDRSPQVQQDLLTSLDQWPLALAGPILLDALKKDGLLVRQIAADKLAARWTKAETFAVRAGHAARQKAVDRLRQEFETEFGRLETESTVKKDSEQAVSPEQIALGRRQLAILQDPRRASADQAQAKRALLAWGADLVGVLTAVAVEENRLIPESVFVELLPKVDPVFVELETLRVGTIRERRAAADRLAAASREKTLGRLALVHLESIMLEETDQLLWRSVLIAVADSESDEAVRLAQIAVGNRSPEIRRRACGYLGAHPRPVHVDVLLPALEDEDPSVVLAAVEAIGLIGKMDDTAPLHRLLRTAGESLRVEVGRVLCLCGDDEGGEVLKRLAHSRDVNVRKRVAQVMGPLGDKRFAVKLVSMLDDHSGVRKAALVSLRNIVGYVPNGVDGKPPRSISEEVRSWRHWLDQKGNASEAIVDVETAGKTETAMSAAPVPVDEVSEGKAVEVDTSEMEITDERVQELLLRTLR